MKPDLRNLDSKNFKERPHCRQMIIRMMKNHDCSLLKLAENYNFFEGMSKQLSKMILEERRNRG